MILLFPRSFFRLNFHNAKRFVASRGVFYGISWNEK